MNRIPHVVRSVLSGVLIVVLTGGGSLPAKAQERPDRRQTRTNISPDLLVSFNRNTPLNQFIEIINPIVVRELGKRVVDPRNRSVPIGVPVSGMHYLDALEKVLEANGLTYRETETVFLVREATADQQTQGVASVDTTEEAPATVRSEERRVGKECRL